MTLALIVLLGLSAVVDLALGAWASVSWRSFADFWFVDSVQSQLIGPGPQLLGLVLGLMLIAFAALQGLAIRWIRDERDDGYNVVYFFATYLMASSLLTTIFLRGHDIVLMGWPLFLLVDGVRGAALSAVAFFAQREPSTISTLRLPEGHKARSSGARSGRSRSDAERRERRSRRSSDRSGRERGGRGRKRRDSRRSDRPAAESNAASGSSGRPRRRRRSKSSRPSGSGETESSKSSRSRESRQERADSGPVNRSRSAAELMSERDDGRSTDERSLAVVVKGERRTSQQDGEDSRRKKPEDVVDMVGLLDESSRSTPSDDSGYGRGARPSRSRKR